MSIVKSFAIGWGDMYYIRHNSDNFTIIDCSMPDDRYGSILADIKAQSKDKNIKRFISSHPDQDHISGLTLLDDSMPILNFYCVDNNATKSIETNDFKRYCQLRDDSEKAFHLYRNCSRKWMNKDDNERGSSGLTVLWPILEDKDHKSALSDAENGMTPNNISCIVKYSVQKGARFLWMGDLESDFMEKLQNKFDLPQVDVLFAPHHGRDSGKVPTDWLKQMNPRLIVIGEAPSEYLNYYDGYNTITQNSSGDILFECLDNKIHIYVGDHTYAVDFLENESKDQEHGLYYIGSLQC